MIKEKNAKPLIDMAYHINENITLPFSEAWIYGVTQWLTEGKHKKFQTFANHFATGIYNIHVKQ